MPVSFRFASAVRADRRLPLVLLSKAALATVAAWVITGAILPGSPPVFASIAALLIVQPSANQSATKAVERSVGVTAGVAIGSSLGLAFGTQPWVVPAAIVTALLFAWILRMTPGVSNQTVISAILVLALGVSTPGYAGARIVETIIGALIGLTVSVALAPTVPVAEARERVDALGLEIAATLDRLAEAFENKHSAQELEGMLLTARLLRPMREAATTAMKAATDALTLNPRAPRYRDQLAQLQDLLERFSGIVIQVIGMTRAVRDHGPDDLAREPASPAIAEQLRRAAHDLRLLTSAPDDMVAPDEEPALTRPLQIQTPSSGNWALIGSILVDLRRVHQAITDPL
ncbi:aromatic acid exporter family protein [Microbacterium sp. zg.Y1090]|uniref:FUSC family protein n=1 Tax=Microbacterium TaxID=33882 RepID=UPI00214B097E|nr:MULTISPECIES: FUSC family protein [unclassified Microbacterium]MCR2811474.1 aromatic acid exporter family protein [Microbacterium sp. zg.Y1084]MCR2819107.1 aromatic acid exporter family protein [Microbacterium sp. zg.Y1090]MDL5487894.1 aromatic acid exporter family protein [Microbacterium sp. zg-Y1211]WIM27410.1 aromatic acid exporter family protein [Microbacterium sp. zg-Y1090]